MRLLVVAGEASGDAIAAETLDSLVARDVGVDAFGVLGSRCRARGARALVRTEDLSAMGLAEVLPRAPAVLRAVAALRREVRHSPPDAALLVDYHELNLRLGRWLRRLRIPVLLVVAPQTWAWRPRRAHTLAESTDRIACILPFEPLHLRALGVTASYVGHPACARPRPTRDEARRTLGLAAADSPTLALLPGSRRGEVSRLAPDFAAALRRLREGGHLRHALVARAPTVELDWLRPLADGGARIVEGDTASALVLAASDAAIVCSGTATVECALAGVPFLVAYRLATSSALIARTFLRVRSVAMPNLLLARQVVPELLQSAVTPEAICRLTIQLLDPRSRVCLDQRAALPRIRELLRPPGVEGSQAVHHIASILIDLATSRRA